MYLESFDRRYDLYEFNYYGMDNGEKTTYVVELTIDCEIEDFVKDVFRTPVVVCAESQFVLIGYTLSEWYEENGKLKVVYVK